jgi:hypothetical protein
MVLLLLKDLFLRSIPLTSINSTDLVINQQGTLEILKTILFYSTTDQLEISFYLGILTLFVRLKLPSQRSISDYL